MSYLVYYASIGLWHKSLAPHETLFNNQCYDMALSLGMFFNSFVYCFTV